MGTSPTAIVLKEMTGSELKAWIGIGSIFAYIYEVIFLNYKFNIFSILSLIVLMIGLYIIVKDEKNKVDYKKILLGLILLIFSKFFYGILINKLTISFSSNITLIIVFSVIAIVMSRFVNVKNVFILHKKTSKIICGTRLVDTIGNLIGNYVALNSVSNYALIQPIQLIFLLVIEFITKDRMMTLKGILGSILAIIGITLFQISKI